MQTQINSYLCVLAVITAATLGGGSSPGSKSPPADQKINPLPMGLRALLNAYPEHLCDAKTNQLIWCDGTVMRYDDGIPKNFAQKLAHPDLEDQMSITYPMGPPSQPGLNRDPGRIRFEPFFKKMYGASPKDVRRRLVRLDWLPGIAAKKIHVTRVNGVANRLKSVMRHISQLNHSSVKIAALMNGSFYWRKIRGTDRQSTHSYGIAVDLAKSHAHYWRWTQPRADGTYAYKNAIPLDIVYAFEREGFIWGGKWYHFDTMHFEYRPELLIDQQLLHPHR